ncbi:MAG: hypothetical protein CSA79_00385 [Thiothrix nivea]|nr:MAG: hypothetical protein CSA79_00385 [Thiothrix nivea]
MKISLKNTAVQIVFYFHLLPLSGQAGIFCSNNLCSETDIQPGTVIVGDGVNGANNLEANLLAQSGVDQAEWGLKKDKDSLEKNGFIIVDKEKIPDIEEHYKEYKDELSTLGEIEDKLSFSPGKAEDREYKLIGVSLSGVVDEKGLASSLVRLYESPHGKIIISEENLASSNAIVFLDKDFLNIKIGNFPASLVVMKSEENDKFFTEIYWINSTKNMAYTVEMNKNMNEDNNLEEREKLLKFLSDNF